MPALNYTTTTMAQLLITAPLHFDLASESWVNYVEQMEAILEANVQLQKDIHPEFSTKP